MKKKRKIQDYFIINVLLVFIFIVISSQLCFALSPSLTPESYIIRVWSEDSGLLTNAITTVTQTHDGYIWIGTQNGLSRFDGVSFKTFTPENTPGLPGVAVKTLSHDRNGDLWIGFLPGYLVKYSKGIFKVALNIGHLSYNSLRCSRDGAIWIGTPTGLIRFYNGKQERIILPGAPSTSYVISIYEDRNGDILAGTNGSGMIRITRKETGFESSFEGFPGEYIEDILVTSDNTLWAATRFNGLLGSKGKEKIQYSTNNGLSNNYISRVYEDRDKNLWIGTYGGGLHRLTDNRISTLDAEKKFPSNVITCLFEDIEGSMYVGTNSTGLIQLTSPRTQSYGTSNGLSPDLFGIYEDIHGTIWIGSMGYGLHKFDGKNAQPLTTIRGSTPPKNVLSVTGDSEGTIWFTTYGGPVYRYKDNTLTAFPLPPEHNGNISRAIYIDTAKHIYVGTDSGALYVFSNNRFELQNRFDSPITYIFKDSKNNIWVGTYETGLVCIPPDDKLVKMNKSTGLSDNYITYIYENTNHSILIGTRFNGLNCIKNGKISIMTTGNGLPHPSIWTIIEDNRHDYWFSSDRGILRISGNELTDFFEGKINRVNPLLLGKDDGMSGNECVGGVQQCGWKSRDGRLWYPVSSSLTVIDPQNLSKNSYVPPVVIHTVSLDNQVLPTTSSCTVPPGTRNIEIHYSGLSFQVPRKVLFKYKLEGFDLDWIDAHTRRVAYYNTLPPGSYTFRVQACNNDGVWNEAGASLPFTVKPFFYQTRIFIFSIILIIAILVFLLFRLRIRRTEKREKELVELVKQRTEEIIVTNSELLKANEAKNDLLNIVAHDLRNRLQVILGFAELIETERDCPISISQNIAHILQSSNHMAELIDDILNTAAINSGKIVLKVERINLSEVAQFVYQAFLPVAQKKSQHIITNIEDNLYVNGDKSRLKESFDNLLSNAVKYSPFHSKIHFSMSRIENKIRIEVKDEGPGLTQNDLQSIFMKFKRLSARPTGGESSTGLGLAITKQMIELHSGQIRVESQPGVGSTFTIELPAYA